MGGGVTGNDDLVNGGGGSTGLHGIVNFKAFYKCSLVSTQK